MAYENVNEVSNYKFGNILKCTENEGYWIQIYILYIFLVFKVAGINRSK